MSQGSLAPTGADAQGRRKREMVVVAAVHAAVVVASWLFASLVYSIVVVRSRQLGWMVVDAAMIAACVWGVRARCEVLGFRSLGERRGLKLLGIVVFGTVCALVVQLVIRDRNGVWLDESHYLATVRAGHIIRVGRLPFNLRWLMPLMAGRWNVLPVDDMEAVKALNFGAFAVTAAFLVLLLVRLRVPLGLAIAAPVFLFCSYLGVYGARNRLVLDAFNYAMYVILFHLAMRREHWVMFAVVLLIDACNAEKAIYWVPVYVLIALLRRDEAPAAKGVALHRHPVLREVVLCCGPTVIYLIAIRWYLADSATEWNLCFENIDVMSLSALGADITNNLVKPNTFQTMWLPFGPFTVYALLGFPLADRWMKPVALLLVPIFIQNLIACDGERMVAYAFIVYLPFGYLYLARALTDMPRALGRTLFGLAIALPLLEHYMFPIASRLRAFALAEAIRDNADFVKMLLSAAELTLVGTIVFVHFTFFARRDPDGAAGRRT
ncbi:MAG TPA: hypothetical protein VGD80_03685 [Kofleriaceae bacterium]